MKKLLLFTFITLLLLPACEKITNINPVPVIKFREYTLEQARDTLGNTLIQGKLLFDFSDDDGADLSTKSFGDTIYSIFTTPYIKNPDNTYLKAEFDTTYYLVYDENMNISKVGQNKTLHGDMEITKNFYVIPADTIRYDFYIVDIDGNKSNVEQTNDIGF